MKWSMLFLIATAFSLCSQAAPKTSYFGWMNPSKTFTYYFQSQLAAAFDGLTKIFNFLRNPKRSSNFPRNSPEKLHRNLQAVNANTTQFNPSSTLLFGKLGQFVHRSKTPKYYVQSELSIEHYTQLLNSLTPYLVTNPSCYNGGIKRDINLTVYTCSNQVVTKKDYEKLQSEESCTVTTYDAKACYCPRDYYGMLCEHRLPLFCSYEWIYPNMARCNEPLDFDSEYYDSSRYGIPPCIFANYGGSSGFVTRLRCVSHPLAVEGYKTLSYYISDPMIENKVSFSYHINTPELVLSHPTKVINVLNILDFNKLTNYVQVVNVSDSTDVILGNAPINFPNINFGTLEYLRYGGRWHVEATAGTFVQGENPAILGLPTRFAVDDIQYVEPTTDNSMNWWVILSIALGAAAGLALILILCICWCKKRREEHEFMTN